MYKIVGMLAVPGQGLFVTTSNVYKSGFKSNIVRNGVKVHKGQEETVGQPTLHNGEIYFPTEWGSHLLKWDNTRQEIVNSHRTHGRWSVAAGEGLVAYNTNLGASGVFKDKAKVYSLDTDEMVWELPIPGMPRCFVPWMDTIWTTINFGGNALCSQRGNIYASPCLHVHPFHGNLYGGGGVDTGPAFGKDGRVYKFDPSDGTWDILYDTGSTSCQQIIIWGHYLVFMFNNPDLVLLMNSKEEFHVGHAWPVENNPDKRDFGIAGADWNGDLWVGRTNGQVPELYKMS